MRPAKRKSRQPATIPGEERGLRLPNIAEGEQMIPQAITPQQHFTEPPPRYNEGSLVKFLEEKGIGRPATYAQIISTIISRGYVNREGKALQPTPLGEVTTKLMEEKFPDIVDCQFTANMEAELDDIEKGEATMLARPERVLGRFRAPVDFRTGDRFPRGHRGAVEETDLICEKCGAKMIVKNGRYGKFAACPNYPQCKNTKPLSAPEKEDDEKPVVADFKCEKCGADMVLRSGRYGSFYACSRYPECKFTKQKTKELDVPCPKCGATLVTKYGRGRTIFYACSRYPECDFRRGICRLSRSVLSAVECFSAKKGKTSLSAHDKACGYKRDIEPEAVAEESGDGNG